MLCRQNEAKETCAAQLYCEIPYNTLLETKQRNHTVHAHVQICR